MIKVTFGATYRVKEGKRWVEKTSQWVETIDNEASAKLRALALNWYIIKIEL